MSEPTLNRKLNPNISSRCTFIIEEVDGVMDGGLCCLQVEMVVWGQRGFGGVFVDTPQGC